MDENEKELSPEEIDAALDNENAAEMPKKPEKKVIARQVGPAETAYATSDGAMPDKGDRKDPNHIFKGETT